MRCDGIFAATDERLTAPTDFANESPQLRPCLQVARKEQRMQSDVKYVKVLGERNSGTNYLSKLVRKNFDIDLLPGTQPNVQADLEALAQDLPKNLQHLARQMLVDVSMREIENRNLGWKHAFPDFELLEREKETASRTLFLVISKEPYSWLKSFHRRPYHSLFPARYMSLSDFIRHPWIATRKENLSPAVVPNMVALWNAKHQGWLSLTERGYQTVFVPYSDLLSNFSAQMEAIGAIIPPRKAGAYENIEDSTKKDGRSSSDFVKQYSNGNDYSAFTPEDIAFVNESVDKDVVAKLGYTLP